MPDSSCGATSPAGKQPAARGPRRSLHQKRTGHRALAASPAAHTMWFHRPFRADEWFLYDQESPIAVGGRGLARGRIYDLEGRLLVSVVQEGLFRKLET
ncbi:acyl-CoA thioesterase [Streptomyces bluensis]|uniref:acyl-CoA thioesterase n=1 Tax=Streptomyces bluensis TaxID=33897 RepID=UPI00227D8972|nr:acyl-CoA thioesterase domain-containing protein [Streptomyces bluensis]